MDLNAIIMINTIGMAIIVDSLRSAASYICKKEDYGKLRYFTKKDGIESLAFIQGSGLEITLQEYGIPLNASSIRTVFFSIMDRRDLING